MIQERKLGAEGAFASEVLCVCIDPNPDLLARVLSIFGIEYAERSPVYQSGALLFINSEATSTSPLEAPVTRTESRFSP